MSMTEYMLMKMEETEGLWTVGVDECGKTVIVTNNGPCHGIQEDGQIITAETLIQLFKFYKIRKKTES